MGNDLCQQKEIQKEDVEKSYNSVKDMFDIGDNFTQKETVQIQSLKEIKTTSKLDSYMT